MRNLVFICFCLVGFISKAETIKTLNPAGQNWSEELQNLFYFTPQGSKIIPYDWAMLLPTQDDKGLFFSSENLAKYGYIAQGKSKLNVDSLPVGFMRDPNPGGYTRKDQITSHIPAYARMPQLGINCAACHTSELKYKDFKLRINGGPSYSNFQLFVSDMDEAIARVATANMPGEANFERFSQFADHYIQRMNTKNARQLSESARTKIINQLRKDLAQFNEYRVQWQKNNGSSSAGIEYGPARNDAFGIIFNQALGDFLGLKKNIRAPNAPVKYPVVWDSPYHEVVQWIGIARNAADAGGPIARNIGQVMGVFGHSDVYDQTLTHGYCTSAKRKELEELEDWLRALKSPTWPKEVFGFDVAKAERGEKHYQKNCADCHQLNERNREDAEAHKKALGITNFEISKAITGKEKKANEQMISISKVGTDGLTAENAYSRTAETGPVKNRPLQVLAGRKLEEVEPAATVLRHVVAGSILGSFSYLTCENTPRDGDANIGLAEKIMSKALGFTKEDTDPPNLTARMDAFKGALEKYKARALNGLWAAPPYLHNGSIRSLKQLLTPPDQRERTFAMNCNDFDPIDVGLNCGDEQKGFVFDTRVRGNSNQGHNFGTELSDDEKMELIEYIKAL